MTFSQAVQSGLNNFFSLSGRASRSQFWWYWLFMFIISGVLGVIGGFLEAAHGIEQTWIGIIVQCLSFILGLSVVFAGVRRLHDTGKSGWNIFWCLLPIIGSIILIVFWCQSSQPFDNRWGPEPR